MISKEFSQNEYVSVIKYTSEYIRLISSSQNAFATIMETLVHSKHKFSPCLYFIIENYIRRKIHFIEKITSFNKINTIKYDLRITDKEKLKKLIISWYDEEIKKLKRDIDNLIERGLCSAEQKNLIVDNFLLLVDKIDLSLFKEFINEKIVDDYPNANGDFYILTKEIIDFIVIITEIISFTLASIEIHYKSSNTENANKIVLKIPITILSLTDYQIDEIINVLEKLAKNIEFKPVFRKITDPIERNELRILFEKKLKRKNDR
jgi:hypothetical protein